MGLFRNVPHVDPGALGSCCEALHQLVGEPEATIRLASNGVVLIAVATADRPSAHPRREWPLFFCPFCGYQLQNQRAVDQLTARGEA
jgi:hypothetical protein